MTEMLNNPKPVADPARAERAAEWWFAALATLAVLALHLYFLNRVGGLWRDEVNSVNLAQGEWRNLTHDSFPILFPLLLRGWNELGLGSTDLTIRSFGVLMGLLLTVTFWISARWTRSAPPLWSITLVALNAWVIYYAASVRAYGLGSALIAFCAAAAWRFIQQPDKKTWLLFTLTAMLSVQTLYQNSALVAAICAGAGAVAWRQKKFKLIVAIFCAGLVAALSLLPYWINITGMAAGAAPLRMDFDSFTARLQLNTLLAFPLPQFYWLWPLLIGGVLLRAIGGIFSKNPDDRSLFSAVMILVGAVAFWFFLFHANFPVQPWYFLPPVALAAVGLELALPRPAGKFRALLFGGLAALAIISGIFGVRVLDYRFTNVDQFAKKISGAARTNDFVVVTPWQFGITFARYFHGPCAWESVPPLGDHTAHRFDLIQIQMKNPEAMSPVLAKISTTLQAGSAVWIVGEINDVGGTNAPGVPPPPPLPRTGWHETPYRFAWNNQLGWLLHRHATNLECLDRGFAEDVNFNERSPLFKVTGWKN